MYQFSTLSLTLINENLDIVADKIQEILKDKSNWQVHKKIINSKDILSFEIQKGLPKHRKLIIWEPELKQNTTIFLSNLQDGWHTLIHVLSTKFEIEVFQIQHFDNKEDYICSLFYKKGQDERIVRVMYDGKLLFWANGHPLPCENLDFYYKKRIKDRFNLSILLEYMRYFDWYIESPKFWESNTEGFYLEEIK